MWGVLGLSYEEVVELDKIQYDTISTNIFIGEDEDAELEEYIPDDGESVEVMFRTLSTGNQILYSGSTTEKIRPLGCEGSYAA